MVGIFFSRIKKNQTYLQKIRENEVRVFTPEYWVGAFFFLLLNKTMPLCDIACMKRELLPEDLRISIEGGVNVAQATRAALITGGLQFLEKQPEIHCQCVPKRK